MVNRVLCHTANSRPHSHPTCSAGLPNADVLMVQVAYLADGGHALGPDSANFPGVQAQGCVLAFACQKLHGRTGAPPKLPSRSLLQLHVVEDGTNRDRSHRKRVARFYVGISTGHDAVADLQAEGCDDITLFSIRIMEESDASRPVRIVLDFGYLCGDTEFITFEVNYPVFFLVP